MVDESANLFYTGLPKVPDEVNSELQKPLSTGELQIALQSMECGRAPGMDGPPIDIYKSFWSVIGDDLLAVLNESLADGLLPLSCRRAFITLLPKKGDLKDIKNWRPISLLCTDLKKISKVLAIRVREVVGRVVHRDQTYCVPNRSIFDNIFNSGYFERL